MQRMAILVSALLVTSCGNDDQPKLRDITVTAINGTASSLRLLEFDYSDTELTKITFHADGTVEGTINLSHNKDGRPTMARWRDVNGIQMQSVEVSYDEAGLVQQIDSTSVTLLANFSTAEARRTDRLHYTDDRLQQIDSLGRKPFDTDVEIIELGETRYEYDDSEGNRLERITAIRRGNSTVTEFDYDDDGRIERLTLAIADVILADSYRYDDEGRLEKVTTDTETYVLSYASGRVEEITVTVKNAGQRTIRYSYAEEGKTTGLVMTPAIPSQEYFGIDGKELDEATFVGFDFLGPL